MTPTELLANWLWQKFDYFLPLPPGVIAEKIVKLFDENGYEIRGKGENK